MKSQYRLYLLLGVLLGVVAGTVTVAGAARSPTGVYSLPNSGATVNPVVSGTTISSTWANTTLGDIGSELTNSLDRGGRGAMTAPLQLSNGTVSLPSLTFGSDTNTGLYRVSGDDMAATCGGVKVEEWTTTGSTMPLGLTVTQSQANVNAVTVTGNGSAAAVVATGGTGGVGSGVFGTGGSSDGTGVKGTGGATNGIGGIFQGTGSGGGLTSTGGATSGTGVVATGGAPNGFGVIGTGTGVGPGGAFQGGATGIGATATGGVTSGTGLAATGGGTSGIGVTGTGGSPNGAGISGTGAGSGSGGSFTGGSSAGSGITAAAGAGGKAASFSGGTLDMNSQKIVNVTDPASAQDAATKAYADGLHRYTILNFGCNATTASATRYAPGGGACRTTEPLRPMPQGGVVSQLWVKMSANTAGDTITVIVRVDGADTTITCATSVSGTSCSDLTHSATISAPGQNLSVSVQDSGGAGTATDVEVSVRFVPT